jgi:hypothetical protein
LDLNTIVKKFTKGIPDNIILLINIAVYIKEARTSKKAIKYIYELIIKIEIAIK